jgi:hypothetical protein
MPSKAVKLWQIVGILFVVMVLTNWVGFILLVVARAPFTPYVATTVVGIAVGFVGMTYAAWRCTETLNQEAAEAWAPNEPPTVDLSPPVDPWNDDTQYLPRHRGVD